MSIHVALHHVTHYRYDKPINLGPQVVRLRPAPHCRTPILSYSLQVEPAGHFVNWQQDPFANYMARLVFPEKTGGFRIAVDLVVELSVYNPFDFFLEERAQTFPFRYDAAVRDELAPYLAGDPVTLATPAFRSYVAGIDRSIDGTIDFLVALNCKLQQDIRYLVRMEPGVQSPAQTLELRSGSCRDSAWLLVQICRYLGLAARFASGYLIQLKPDVKSLDGPSGAEVDFTDLHAWCEVYLPGAGWIGFDPTSGLLAGEGHIPLACTPQPMSAAPVEGLVDECEVEFSHEMNVTRIHESPRVTRPYTEAQWQDVLSLGQAVDADLRAGDVRLTQGGEPTFVAIDGRDGAEWNTEALGPTKRGYATELLQRLCAEYGQGGFLHFGQGKWYPGEQLPRWALSIFWREDGQPAWHNPALFADERVPSHYTADDARRFIEALAGRLDLGGDTILPGYEDVWYYLWRERRLPVNIDPFDARLDDELERARLRQVFDRKLDSVVGYLLPLSPSETGAGPRWRTGPWLFRDKRMYLYPGDSPMGFRLPLDALPWVSESDYPYTVERDPFAPRDALPGAQALRARYAAVDRASAGPAGRAEATAGLTADRTATRTLMQRPGAGVDADVDAARYPQRHESAAWTRRTALCVEARNGILYVFMPPLAELEDYLDLLGAIEATAENLAVELVLEGYPPPRDARLTMLQVTPDPGVVEVNIHPSRDFGELVQRTEFLYDAAYQSRLCSEKFMVDGRHTGTGGGNHFVLGGATPADSPFLRRPDLLASLIAYWHNHPSLSYLFSGLFVGPTSQAPRVDEARNDQVYELELALDEIERHRQRLGADMPPWLVDRMLRNVLIDVTGNTHRSEFCIDKLYSPDSATGRLGLLELRAFEMPPHARMSIVQQLLLRALIARFWKQPYTARLTRWGTALHDRFLLPSFLKMDFADVLAEMNETGYAFDTAWFAPHFEFRFPSYGQVSARGIQLSLRGALEPWHVMGEENTSGGTARYVDSSLERLEVHVSGLNDNRYIVTVNGQALPLQPTGTVGEYVAGVRYKAWAPSSALHPTIGVHAPLTFDIVDTWMQRSLGGCQYHVAHAGGRSYDTLPVNAYEAESRRLARFFSMGHTPGRMTVEPATPSREFPATLDLRRTH